MIRAIRVYAVAVASEVPLCTSFQSLPDTKVRLLSEVDQGVAGRYLWVKSLEVVK